MIFTRPIVVLALTAFFYLIFLDFVRFCQQSGQTWLMISTVVLFDCYESMLTFAGQNKISFQDQNVFLPQWLQNEHVVFWKLEYD